MEIVKESKESHRDADNDGNLLKVLVFLAIAQCLFRRLIARKILAHFLWLQLGAKSLVWRATFLFHDPYLYHKIWAGSYMKLCFKRMRILTDIWTALFRHILVRFDKIWTCKFWGMPVWTKTINIEGDLVRGGTSYAFKVTFRSLWTVLSFWNLKPWLIVVTNVRQG